MDQPSFSPAPATDEPAPVPAPVVPVQPIPQPRVKKPRWPWFIGILVPVVCIGAFVAATAAFSIPDTFLEAYLGQIGGMLLVVAFAPMFVGLLLHIPALGMSVGGFGFPSPLGLALSVLGWMVIGRGLYALYHSRLRVVVWLILVAGLGALLWFAYGGTAEWRVMEEARTTGTTASCDRLEGEQKGYCLIEAAVGANDPTMCDAIPGFQRTACYNRLNAPYTPLPGMK